MIYNACWFSWNTLVLAVREALISPIYICLCFFSLVIVWGPCGPFPEIGNVRCLVILLLNCIECGKINQQLLDILLYRKIEKGRR